MSEQPTLISPLSSAIRYGVAISFILIISTWYSISDAVANNHPVSNAVNYTQVGIILMGLALAMMHHRRKFEGRIMRYTEALGAGIITALIGGIILAIFTFFFFYLNDDLRAGLEKISFDALTQEKQKTSLELGKDMTPFSKVAGSAMFSFSMMLFYGLLGSLIMAVFFQKRK